MQGSPPSPLKYSLPGSKDSLAELLAGKGTDGVEQYGEFLAKLGTHAANKITMLGEGEVVDKLQSMVYQTRTLLNYLVEDQPDNPKLGAAAERSRAAWQATQPSAQPADSST